MINMVRNEAMKDNVGVTSIMNKMRKARLRWFEHLNKRCREAPSMLVCNFCHRRFVRVVKVGRIIFGEGD